MNNRTPLSQRPWPSLDVSDARIVVTGFGVSGFAAADQTMQRGAHVTVLDSADTPENRERAQILEVLGVQVRLGAEHTADFPADLDCDVVVTSPGWPLDHPVLTGAAARGIPIWSEVELARRMQNPDGPLWLGITGTNGKTTTVTMLEKILVASGLRAVACGNVGLPIIEAALDPEGYDVLAVELSSFQLERTEHVHCESAVVLNISDDHLDWHGNLEAYQRAKGRIYEQARTACVYNTADQATERLVADADVREGARAIGLTLGAPQISQLGVVDGCLVDRAFLEDRRTTALLLTEPGDLDHLGPSGPPPHAVLDALAAAALARSIDVPPSAVQAGLRSYHMGKHRAEHVATINGVHYVNDTKATNPAAARASLAAATDVVWIAGGDTKGADLDSLIAASAPNVRAVVLIGSDPAPFLDALARHAPQIPVHRIEARHTDVSDATGESTTQRGGELMTEAVSAARSVAKEGSMVLLAPAAASWDQFRNYAERGELFTAAVNALAAENDTPPAPREGS